MVDRRILSGFLPAFQQGFSTGSRAIENRLSRAQQQAQFQQQQEATAKHRGALEGFRKRELTMKEEEAGERKLLFPHQVAEAKAKQRAAELGLEEAEAQAGTLQDRLAFEQKERDLKIKTYETDITGKRVTADLRRAQRDKYKAEIQALKQKRLDQEAMRAEPQSSYQTQRSLAVEHPQLARKKWEMFQQWRKAQGRELEPFEKKAGFEAMSDNIKARRLRDEYIKLVESVKGDTGFDDLPQAAQVWMADNIPGVRQLWGKAGGRAKKVQLVNQALVKNSIATTKAEPNSIPMQQIVNLSQQIKPGDGDERLDEIIQGIKLEHKRQAAEFLAPLEAMGFVTGEEEQQTRKKKSSNVDLGALLGG